MVFNRLSLRLILILFLAALVVVYWRFNPGDNRIFPKCPFYWLTGYRCMGCGSQRAIHSLLNLRVGEALHQNLLVVVSIPYLITGFVIDIVREPGERTIRLRRTLYGYRAIIVVLFILVTFWILRNLPFFQSYI